MDDMLTQLQETLSHQQRDIDKLSDVLYEQQKDMEAMRKQIARLETALRGENGIRPVSEETPPPHY